MIEQYLPLVRKEALLIKLRLPANVELDDLIQSGTLGLLDAVKKQESSDNINFEAYARQRIRGSIIDELRKNDWVPRRIREVAKTVQTTIQRLNSKLGRNPEDREVAHELGVSMEEYGQMLLDSNCTLLVSFDELGVEKVDEQSRDQFPSPLNALVTSREQGRVSQAIGSLPEKEKQMLALYYQEDMNLKEIGAVFGVSESRVCQIHSQAISRLRAILNPAMA